MNVLKEFEIRRKHFYFFVILTSIIIQSYSHFAKYISLYFLLNVIIFDDFISVIENAMN